MSAANFVLPRSSIFLLICTKHSISTSHREAITMFRMCEIYCREGALARNGSRRRDRRGEERVYARNPRIYRGIDRLGDDPGSPEIDPIDLITEIDPDRSWIDPSFRFLVSDTPLLFSFFYFSSLSSSFLVRQVFC